MISRRRLLGLAALGLLPTTLGSCRAALPKDGKLAALWYSYGGKNRQVLEALVTRFNRRQTEHYVHAVYQGDYFEGLAKLRTALAAGAGPTFSHVIGEVVPYLDYAGVLEPLGEYPGAHEFGVIPELGQEKSWVGGGGRPLVALPFNRSTPIAYLNGQHFSQAGLGAPTTWAELRQAASVLTRRQGNRIERHGFGCPISWWFWVALMGQAGGEIVDAEGRVSLGGEAGVRAVEFWQTLVHLDRTMKLPPGRDYDAWEATNKDFLAGRTSMIWTSTAFLKYLEENARFPVLAAPLPRQERRAVPTGGTHWVMLRHAPAPAKQAAWAFLRYMHEPEQVIEWATSTGYLPVTRGGVERLERAGYYGQHPNDRVALDQLAFAQPWPWVRELVRIEREIVEPRLEDAVLSRQDPRPLLQEARRLARREGS
jgi:sn-glycerol 3-phosphate transport system substrate-binding protein